MLAGAALAAACPFCNVESQTLTEEINGSEAVVLAKLVAEAPPIAVGRRPDDDPDSGKATFQIVEVLRGGDRVKAGRRDQGRLLRRRRTRQDVHDLGHRRRERRLDWTTPLPLSATAVEYVRKLPTCRPPAASGLRSSRTISRTTIRSWPRTPTTNSPALRMPSCTSSKATCTTTGSSSGFRAPDVNPSRRRLYLTMLGVCGDERRSADARSDDRLRLLGEEADRRADGRAAARRSAGRSALDMWTEMVDLEERQKKLGLDATVGCYLIAPRPGRPRPDRRAVPQESQGRVHARLLDDHGPAVPSAKRRDAVPRERLLASMRLLLDNPEFADQVIPDLARWEDWSVLDRLVEMYKNGDEKSYVRQPVVTYLTVASEQPGDVGTRAKAALAELEQLDPEGVKKAQSLMAFGFLARARSTAPPPAHSGPSDAGDDRRQRRDAADVRATTASRPARPTGRPKTTTPAKFPQPPGYVEVPPNDDDDADDESTTSTTKPPTRPTKTVAAAEVEAPPEPTTYSRPLVIGIPLAAALVLMAVYWLILRWGAM